MYSGSLLLSGDYYNSNALYGCNMKITCVYLLTYYEYLCWCGSFTRVWKENHSIVTLCPLMQNKTTGGQNMLDIGRSSNWNFFKKCWNWSLKNERFVICSHLFAIVPFQISLYINFLLQNTTGDILKNIKVQRTLDPIDFQCMDKKKKKKHFQKYLLYSNKERMFFHSEFKFLDELSL